MIARDGERYERVVSSIPIHRTLCLELEYVSTSLGTCSISIAAMKSLLGEEG